MITAAANRRSNHCQQILRSRAPLGERLDRPLRHLELGSSPAGVDCRYPFARGVRKENWNAIGCFYCHRDPGVLSPQRIRLWISSRSLRTKLQHPISVHLGDSTDVILCQACRLEETFKVLIHPLFQVANGIAQV